jgi:hypothetical protein
MLCLFYLTNRKQFVWCNNLKSELRDIILTFEYQGYKIISKNSVKYLGLIYNDNLDGKEIVNSIIKKVKMQFMYCQAKYLDLYTTKIVGTSQFPPLFDYSLTAYY